MKQGRFFAAANRVAEQEVQPGIPTVFLRRTSVLMIVQENMDPDVLPDLNDFFNWLIPDGGPAFRHIPEGPDGAAAHIRSAAAQTQLSVPVINERLVLRNAAGHLYFQAPFIPTPDGASHFWRLKGIRLNAKNPQIV